MHDAVPDCAACNCARMSGSSFGECSVSSSSQSKPECDTISAAIGLHRLHHSPICNWPLAIACLKALRGMSMGRSSPLDRDDFSSNRHPDLVLCLSMIFSETGSHFSGSCSSGELSNKLH